MSIHPSLKIDTAGAQQKTVLSRIQRIKGLMKKGKWQDIPFWDISSIRCTAHSIGIKRGWIYPRRHHQYPDNVKIIIL